MIRKALDYAELHKCQISALFLAAGIALMCLAAVRVADTFSGQPAPHRYQFYKSLYEEADRRAMQANAEARYLKTRMESLGSEELWEELRLAEQDRDRYKSLATSRLDALLECRER